MKCVECGEADYLPGPEGTPNCCWQCVEESASELVRIAMEQIELFNIASGEEPYKPETSTDPVKCNDCENQIPKWFAAGEHQGWCLDCLAACDCGAAVPKWVLAKTGGSCFQCDIKRFELEGKAKKWEETE